MADYDTILAGVEAQGKREELARLRDYVNKRLSEITGVEAAGAEFAAADPRLASASGYLDSAFNLVKDFCAFRIYKREVEAEGGIVGDEASSAIQQGEDPVPVEPKPEGSA